MVRVGRQEGPVEIHGVASVVVVGLISHDLFVGDRRLGVMISAMSPLWARFDTP